MVRARIRSVQPRPRDCERDARSYGGELLAVHATATDPDGDALSAYWCYDPYVSRYSGERDLTLWRVTGLAALFAVPRDARAGDRFVLRLTVRDEVELPLTRYAEVAVTVH